MSMGTYFFVSFCASTSCSTACEPVTQLMEKIFTAIKFQNENNT